MTLPTFRFNTVLLCYNCRRQAVVFIKKFVHQTEESQHALGLRFVSCGMCAKLPHVFNPGTSLRKEYTDLQHYANIIDALKDKFKHKVTVFKAKRVFSIAKLAFKTVAQIEDCDLLQIDDDLFYILDHEEGDRFFPGEFASLVSRAVPTIKQQGTDDNFVQPWQMPELALVEPPPPYTTAPSSP